MALFCCPATIDDCASTIHLTRCEIMRQYTARFDGFAKGYVIAFNPSRSSFHHRVLNVGQCGIANFVFDVDCGAFHFSKGHTCAFECSITMCFKESGSKLNFCIRKAVVGSFEFDPKFFLGKNNRGITCIIWISG